MIYPFLITFVVGIFLATQARLYTANIESNKRAVEARVHNASLNEEELHRLTVARDNYIKVYNRMPANVDTLISSGFLEASFRNSELSKKVTIANGRISFTTSDVGLDNVYIVANLEKYNSNLELNAVSSLRNQSDTINLIKSNDADTAKSVDFSSVVKKQNSNLGASKATQFDLNSKKVDESSNNTNNTMLKVLTF